MQQPIPDKSCQFRERLKDAARLPLMVAAKFDSCLEHQGRVSVALPKHDERTLVTKSLLLECRVRRSTLEIRKSLDLDARECLDCAVSQSIRENQPCVRPWIVMRSAAKCAPDTLLHTGRKVGNLFSSDEVTRLGKSVLDPSPLIYRHDYIFDVQLAHVVWGIIQPDEYLQLESLLAVIMCEVLKK